MNLSIFRIIQGIVRLRGNTDGTLIGNVGDRLKVEATQSLSPSAVVGTNQWSAGTIFTALSSGTKNPGLFLRNPSGSGKVIYVRRLDVGISVTNVAVDFYLFSNPTVMTNGSTINSYPCNIGYSQGTPVGLLTVSPVVTSLGNQMLVISSGQNTQANPLAGDFIYAIQPGNSLLVAADPSSNGRNVSNSIVWREE